MAQGHQSGMRIRQDRTDRRSRTALGELQLHLLRSYLHSSQIAFNGNRNNPVFMASAAI